jgi:hypothetical protein
MTRARTLEIADRKALLAARAELDRARVTLAAHEVKAIVSPPADAARASVMRPAVAMLIGLVAPAIGISRARRWLRIAAWGLAAWRVARNWRTVRS